MHLQSYLRSAEKIITEYNGAIPFASWLKDYFRQHKKFGSKDRKVVSDLCFCFFRLGKAFQNKSIEERLFISQFLCHNSSAFVAEFKPDLGREQLSSINHKLKLINDDDKEIFPFEEELSNAIETQPFVQSHFTQPDLFLRIRPGKESKVLKTLESAAISFKQYDTCIQVANTTKIDAVLQLDTDVVVQDKSSQQVLQPLKRFWKTQTFSSWDCCAASGGKTILLHDLFPKARLTVSDIRESILHNLRNRFKRAVISNYRSFVTDVSSPTFHASEYFDVVICDAPCSGSGTWGRTPEQLFFFKKEKIGDYAHLQKQIATNASKCLKKGAAFLYITCSVFKKENEDVVSHLLAHTPLQLVEQQYFKGYEEKADTLFVALLTL